MALTLTLALLPVPDTQLIEALQNVAKYLPNSILNATFQWRLFDNDSNNVSFFDIGTDANIKSILELRGEIFRWCALMFQVNAQPNNQGGSVIIDRVADGSLTVTMNLPDVWSSKTDAKTQAALAVRNAFTRYTKSKILETLNPVVSDFYSRRESSLIQLEALNAKIIVENDQHRRDLERALEDTRQQLDQAHQTRLEALEGQFRSKDEALTKRESELDERKKLLDDRDNTHARRQIQLDLKEVLKERNTDFSLTKRTIRKRWPSAIALIGLMSALAIASGWALWATTRPLSVGEPFWYPLSRLALSLFAFGSSVVFYIRWQDRWAEAHATEEFRLKRFDLDLARASWLVEVMLEWNSAKAEFPKELIQKLATGLFEQVDAGPLVKHPAEEMLAALLSSPASVNLKFPGGDVSLDRKGVKEMARKTD